MNWQMVKVLALTVCLTAFAFEGFHSRRGMLIRQSFCDTWGGTWLGYFCPDRADGGGSSGAE